MDRLLCGDVGFGKTEVAIRAAFKCVMDAKQCAVLVPTTILAWQHYQTFLRADAGVPGQRWNCSPASAAPSSRSRSCEELRRGEVDIIIGTHRLLQKDVQI